MLRTIKANIRLYFLKDKYLDIQKIFTEHLYYAMHFTVYQGKEEKSMNSLKKEDF